MGQTILTVDDAASIRDLVDMVFTDLGYQVTKSEGGREAIECLQKARPDLVLLDLLMPEVDGWKVLDFITTLPDPPAVVIVSAHTEIEPGRRLPFCVGGYVPKPFDLGQLTSTCEAVLTRRRVVEAAGLRRDPRRTFLVRATLLSNADTPLLTAQVHNISRHGLSVELSSLAEGASLRLSMAIPGLGELILPGRVAWKSGIRAGIELDALDDQTRRALDMLLEPGH